MSAVEKEPALVEWVRLRRVSRTVGFAAVRLSGVHLQGLRVEEKPDGKLALKAPETEDKTGRRWPAYAIQPGWLEAVEREVACLWARS